MADDKTGNGTNGQAASRPEKDAPPKELSAEARAKLGEIREKLAQAFSTVTLAMMSTPRYRHLTLADLEWLALQPILHDRLAIASSKPAEGKEGTDTTVGIAIWAKVSEAVSAKIEEQVRSRTFPIRLKADEWNSGDLVWLLDVIAPNRTLATSVLVNFGQVAKDSRVRIHPAITKMVDPEVLEKLGKAAAEQKPETR